MNVDTGAFTALTGQVAALEAEVTGLRRLVTCEDRHAAAIRETLIDLGRALGRAEAMAGQAAPRRPRRRRPGYLQVLGDGGAP